MKPYRFGRTSNKRWGKLFLSIGVLLVVVGAAAYLGLKTMYERNLQPVDPSASENIVFTVKLGATPAQIGEELNEKQLIRSTRAFRQYVRSNELGELFKAGTYRLQQSMTVQEIVDLLISGEVATDLFTIYPGQPIESVRQTLVEDGGFSAALVDRALSSQLYDGHPALVDKPAKASLEGFLYPDSYEKADGTTPQTIIRQALDEMAEALTPDIRAGIASHGLSIYQGIILASIVEKEVGAVDINGNPNDNRAKAAQVFLKRLDIGMKLQSNATDRATEERGAEYNTYQIEGLPPEPVSNVTLSSLKAVAKPANTNYLYFVAGRDCVTRFSETNDQHEALKSRHGVAQEEDGCRG